MDTVPRSEIVLDEDGGFAVGIFPPDEDRRSGEFLDGETAYHAFCKWIHAGSRLRENYVIRDVGLRLDGGRILFFAETWSPGSENRHLRACIVERSPAVEGDCFRVHRLEPELAGVIDAEGSLIR